MPDGVIDGGDPLHPASPPLRSPRADGGDPPLLRLATWNVNSIRTRLDRVLDWLRRAEVDVLAMQETKCADDQFPTLPFFELGYEVAHCGFNQWNGVAIASRVGLDDIEVGFAGQPTWSSSARGDRQRGGAGRGGSPQRADAVAAAEARALAATCAGVRVWSLYVPNGRAVGDPHYTYKLNWLAALRDTAEGWLRDDPSAQIALVGDWNIAPTDDDVWSVEFYRGCTHVSEPERKAFNAIVDAQFTDVVRPFAPGPGAYTYWDYTALRFPKGQGMRIDFILASPALAVRVVDAKIVRDERKGKAPSDHAPVMVDLRRD
jgi:exodeoxyribonuclease-3